MQIKFRMQQAEVWRCQYPTQCKKARCSARATVIIRYVDDQGRPLRQVEFCARHQVGEITKSGIVVRDMR